LDIIGKDWGPPVESWKLSLDDDEGKKYAFRVDPTEGGPDLEWMPPKRGDDTDPEHIQPRQNWAFEGAGECLKRLAFLLPHVHPTQRSEILRRVQSFEKDTNDSGQGEPGGTYRW